MKRREEVGEVWWEVRWGEWMVPAARGRVVARWRIRVAWVSVDRSDDVSMNTGAAIDDFERESEREM